jgi:hypothetical protein
MRLVSNKAPLGLQSRCIAQNGVHCFGVELVGAEGFPWHCWDKSSSPLEGLQTSGRGVEVY